MPHDDPRTLASPEFFATKIYVPLMTNAGCFNTCED